MGRKNRQQRKQAQSQKSGYLPYNIFGGDVLPYLHAVPTNYDLEYGDFGALTAYQTIGIVNRCDDLLAQAINSLDWQVVRDSDGDDQIVSTSEDRKPRHPAAQAIQNVYRDQGVPLFSLMSHSRNLFGATYIEKCMNEYGFNRGLRWLNPHAMSLHIVAGRIEGYRYMPINGGEYAPLTPHQVAYDHTFNPSDDLRGLSKVDAALSAINLTRSLKSYVRNVLINGMTGMVLAPASDANSGISGMFTPHETAALERQASDFHTGTRNAGRTLISPRPLNVTTLNPPELDKHWTLIDSLTKEICVVFGVPLAMAGDSSSSTYKDGEEVRQAFYINTVIPLARTLQDFFNTKIMPFLDPDGDCTFQFDTAQFEDSTASDKAVSDLVTVQTTSGLLTLADAQRAQGLTVYPEYERLVMVNGQIMPLEKVGQPAPFPASPFDMPDTSRLEIQAPETPQLPARAEYVFEKPLPVDEWRRKALEELKDMKRWAKRVEELRASGKHEKADKTPAFQPVYVRYIFEDFYKSGSLVDPGFSDYEVFFDHAFAAVRYEPFKATRARIDHVFDPVTRKDIGETRQEFEDEFLLAIADAKEGNLTKTQLRSLLHTVIRTLGEQAYRDGLEDGGVKDAELSDEDLAEIARIRRTSEGYANDFVKEFDTYSEAQLDQRPKMWTLKTLNEFYLAGLASADANGIYVWRLGKTEEHCDTCLQMNGQRMRLKTWIKNGILPQSDKLACKGFNCDCGLFNIRGGARG